MTKIDIFSGFLGAGKTTLIKKLLKEAYKNEKLMLIENEFGEIGIDGGFMQDAGIQITEMNSGCICCSLVGDFGKALKKALDEYHPDRILIEPSGVGKLSDVIRAVQGVHADGAVLNGFTTVVDANKCKMYMKNFGEFFNDQIENAGCIVLSHTDNMADAKIEQCVAMIREHNTTATIVVTPWGQLDGAQLLEAMERKDTISAELDRLKAEAAHDDDDDDECCHDHEHHHHHHHDDDEEHGCCCGHHHDDDDDDDDDEHEHEHHHDHDHEEHEHHHEEGEHACGCGCGHDHDDDDEHEHEHHHHHHHHADEVFESFGAETTKKFTAEEIRSCLEQLQNAVQFGIILRAKGIVAGEDGKWIHFDYVPGEADVRNGSAGVIGRLCVIGSKLDHHEIEELFGVKEV